MNKYIYIIPTLATVDHELAYYNINHNHKGSVNYM